MKPYPGYPPPYPPYPPPNLPPPNPIFKEIQSIKICCAYYFFLSPKIGIYWKVKQHHSNWINIFPLSASCLQLVYFVTLKIISTSLEQVIMEYHPKAFTLCRRVLARKSFPFHMEEQLESLKHLSIITFWKCYLNFEFVFVYDRISSHLMPKYKEFLF